MKKALRLFVNKIRKLSWPVRIISVVVIIAFGYFGYSKLIRNKSTQVQYKTTTVEKGTLVSSVTASGKVSTANNTPIVTQVTGVITKLYVKNGDRVAIGDPIATLQLDQTSIQKYVQQQASYLSAKNSLESAKTSLKTLGSTMLNAQEDFLQDALNKGKDEDNITYMTLNLARKVAEEKYKQQEQVIKQAELSYSSASMSLRNYSPTIYAPISGTITGLSLQEGSVIPAQAVSSSTNTLSQNIANITTSNFPIVSVDLTEIDIPKVKVGAKATVTFDAFPDKTYTGKIFSIDTTGSVSSGVTTYPTTIILDTENKDVYANMSVTAYIIIESVDNVLYVPTSAIQTQNDQSTVRILKNGKDEYVAVETGFSTDTSTEIKSGLAQGDEIVTTVVSAITKTTSSSTNSPFGIRTGGFNMARPRD